MLVASLFDRARSEIHAFAVKPTFTYAGSSPHLDLEFDLVDVPPLDASGTVEEAAERMGEEGFEISSSTARGNPAEEILREMDRGRYDLVVLGGSHTTWMGNLLLGSVSTQVLHHAPCSVVVAHRAPNAAGRVLLGIDGSGSAAGALELAMKVLNRSRCALTVASAVRLPLATVHVYPAGPVFTGSSDHENIEKRLMERAWHLVDRARSRIEKGGFDVEGTILLGQAGPQLLKETDNIGADLVVVGSRGLGPVRRTLLGSVSDQVVRHAPATLVGRGS